MSPANLGVRLSLAAGTRSLLRKRVPVSVQACSSCGKVEFGVDPDAWRALVSVGRRRG